MPEALPFPDVSAEIAAYYGKRLRYRARRALNQGVGLFLLGVVAIVAAGIVYRQAWMQSKMATDGMKRYFDSPQLIGDQDKRAVLSGIVTSGVRDEMRLESAGCFEEDSACIHGELLLERTQRVAAALAGRKDPTADDIVEALSASGSVPPQGKAIADRLMRYWSSLSIAEKDADLSASHTDDNYAWPDCGESADDQVVATQRCHLFDLEPAQCHDDPAWITKALIPEPEVGQGDRHARRIRAMQRSAALEAAIAADSSLLQQPTSSAPDTHRPALFQLVQAYYISVDSVLRIWQRNSRAGNFDLPKARLWAARPYFTHFLAERNVGAEPYTSPPYLDLGGYGVVQTRCRQVLEPYVVGESGIKGKRVSGIVCFDLALTGIALRRLARNLAQTPLIDVAIFCGFGGKFVLGPCSAGGDDPHATGSREAGDDRVRSVLASMNSQISLVESVVDSSVVSDTRMDSETWYLLPVSKGGQGTTTFAIRPTVERTTGLLSKPLWLGMLLGVALILISVAAWQSNALSLSEERLALLRTLPTAAIETDINDNITGANDRAEELLRIPLQRFGLQGGAVPDTWAVFDKEDLRQKDAPDKKLDVSRTRRDRTEGRTTGYFVCRQMSNSPGNAGKEWFLLHACPVLAPARTLQARWLRAELRATFGTLSRVTDAQILSILNAPAKP
jgi:PAS domain-containing protein